MKQAVFIDRDGTIIKAIERADFEKKVTAPFKYSELEFYPDVKKGLGLLKKAGFLRILVTNQPDVAHGYMSKKEWLRIHRAVIKLDFDDICICRHRTQDNCPMKKPFPTMLMAAACKWDILLGGSYMIGDTENDILAGNAAGCKTILLRRPYNEGSDYGATYSVQDDFFSAALTIVTSLDITAWKKDLKDLERIFNPKK